MHALSVLDHDHAYIMQSSLVYRTEMQGSLQSVSVYGMLSLRSKSLQAFTEARSV